MFRSVRGGERERDVGKGNYLIAACMVLYGHISGQEGAWVRLPHKCQKSNC